MQSFDQQVSTGQGSEGQFLTEMGLKTARTT